MENLVFAAKIKEYPFTVHEDEYEEEASRDRDGRDAYYVRMREAAAIRAARASMQHTPRRPPSMLGIELPPQPRSPNSPEEEQRIAGEVSEVILQTRQRLNELFQKTCGRDLKDMLPDGKQ